VVIGETAAVFRDFLNEGVALLVVVMEVHFDVADTEANNLRYTVENIPPILLLRVEKAVLRTLACGISGGIVGNAWPSVAPPRNPAEGGFERNTHAPWFVVIGDGNPRALRLFRLSALPQAVLQIRQEPDFCVSRELH
jgi:hypothetical protein